MTSLYTCARCCRRLSRRANRFQELQWQARASFISLSHPQPPPPQEAAEPSVGDGPHNQVSQPRQYSRASPASARSDQAALLPQDAFLQRLFDEAAEGRYSRARQSRKPEPPAQSRLVRSSQPVKQSEPSAQPEFVARPRLVEHGEPVQRPDTVAPVKPAQPPEPSRQLESLKQPQEPTERAVLVGRRDPVERPEPIQRLEAVHQPNVLTRPEPAQARAEALAHHDPSTNNKNPRRRPAGPASQIEELLSSRNPDNLTTNARKAWELFQTHFSSKDSPHLVNPPAEDLGKLKDYSTFHSLRKSLASRWLVSQTARDLPCPSQVVAELDRLDMMTPVTYADTLWRMLTKMLRHEPREDSAVLVEEIMSVWKMFFQRYIKPTFNTSAASKERPDGWTCLPGLEHLTARRSDGTRLNDDPNIRMLFFMEQRFRMTSTLLMTFDLLTHQAYSDRVSTEQQSKYAHFIKFGAHVFAGANISSLLPRIETRLEMGGVSREDAQEVMARVKDASFRALVASNSPNPKDSQQPWRGQQEEFFVKRLSRVLERKETAGLDTVWEEMQTAFQNPKSPSSKAVIPNGLYDHLLMTAWGMKKAERALEIWNFMIANGTKPTVKTWTAMLNGCAKSRDITSLETIWQRMLASGTRPDAHAWSTRIFGLLLAKRFQEGLAVLNQMGQVWLQAVQSDQGKGNDDKSKGPKANIKFDPTTMGDHPTAPKPNVSILNAVVTALSRYNRKDLIAKVFPWARAYGIAPDAATFNILIQIAFREGNLAEAENLLKQMEAQSIRPDVRTFTIVTNAVFRSEISAAAHSPEQQTALVASTLADLEARGLEASAWVFSTMIDGLLKHHDNVPAARAVLEYMGARNIQLSPHIYTILMTHFFAQNPPDLAAVDALWRNMNLVSAPKDLVFYDRMVEGFARAGEVGRMMVFLARMGRDGKSPGWLALKEVVKALAAAGDWVRFDEVVADVERGEGFAKEGIIGRGDFGRLSFWELVEELRGERGFFDNRGG